MTLLWEELCLQMRTAVWLSLLGELWHPPYAALRIFIAGSIITSCQESAVRWFERGWSFRGEREERERGGGRPFRERVCVCVCVCEWERESVCVCVRERDSEWVWESERGVCERECEREREISESLCCISLCTLTIHTKMQQFFWQLRAYRRSGSVRCNTVESNGFQQLL